MCSSLKIFNSVIYKIKIPIVIIYFSAALKYSFGVNTKKYPKIKFIKKIGACSTNVINEVCFLENVYMY